jgi:hypothetical protein
MSIDISLVAERIPRLDDDDDDDNDRDVQGASQFFAPGDVITR